MDCDVTHLFSRDAQNLEVDGAHDGQRQEVGADGDDERVDGVQLEHAAVRLRPVLHRAVDRVPAGVDRHEADERRERPDAGVQLPDEPHADRVVVDRVVVDRVVVDRVVVAERPADGEVAVQADGEPYTYERRTAEEPIEEEAVDGTEQVPVCRTGIVVWWDSGPG